MRLREPADVRDVQNPTFSEIILFSWHQYVFHHVTVHETSFLAYISCLFCYSYEVITQHYCLHKHATLMKNHRSALIWWWRRLLKETRITSERARVLQICCIHIYSKRSSNPLLFTLWCNNGMTEDGRWIFAFQYSFFEYYLFAIHVVLPECKSVVFSHVQYYLRVRVLYLWLIVLVTWHLFKMLICYNFLTKRQIHIEYSVIFFLRRWIASQSSRWTSRGTWRRERSA